MLAALALGGLILSLALGALGIGALVQARAALSAAADAAALAADQATAAVQVTLRVTYASYRCADARGWARRAVIAEDAVPALACVGPFGGSTLVAATALGFASTVQRGFGPDPAWAVSAGCQGTIWHRPATAGAWRICEGQSLSGAELLPAAVPALRAVAEHWIHAALRQEPAITDPAVDRITIGAAGDITVQASAMVSVPLFGRHPILVHATAWPSVAG